MTFQEFMARYASSFRDRGTIYMAELIDQMILDDRANEVEVAIEIEKNLILKRSDDIVDKGYGWSTSSYFIWMLEDWAVYQLKGENFFDGIDF